MNKQAIVIRYIRENYLDFGRIRHDVVSDKLQVQCAHRLGDEAMRLEGDRAPQNATSVFGDPAKAMRLEGDEAKGTEYWREMTRQDINSIVCQCAQEYDANISYREVITALQSDLIPDVHPLREYILSLKPYTPDQPDWIDMVARQVRVKNNNAECEINKDNLNNICSAPQKSADFSGTPPRPTLALAKDDILSSPLSNVLISLRSNDRVAYGEAEELSMLSSEKPTPLSPQNNPADALWRLCFKKWFVAMVASWMRDEVVNHQVLVLIGKQGIYKTTWLEHLIPPELRSYCCKMSNISDLNKDERLRIAEFGLINMDEIDALHSRELNQLKSLITSSDVNERAPYAYSKERRVRLASFCASGNRRDFLTDITGNRRWLPFEVESIQNPFFTTLPYDLMYAQAWALAQDPIFSYWFELDEIEVLEEHNQHFRDESNEEQLLMVYFAVPAEGSTNAKFLTTAEISEKLVSRGNIKCPMRLNQLGAILHRQGFIAKRKGTPARRGWIVYERDSEDINAERKQLAKTKIADSDNIY